MRLLRFPLCIVIIFSLTCHLRAEDHHEDHSDEECKEHTHHDLLHEAEGSNPFVHYHFTDLSTPLMHSFGIEPAFTGRDLISIYRFRDLGAGVSEHEIEAELEWAFTNEFGVVLEIPRVFENVPGQPGRDGFGDLVIVPRFNFLKKDRFYLTAEMGITTPTGTNGFGGDTAIAPGLAAWNDFGNWWTMHSRIGIEHSFTEDSNALTFGVGLMKTLGAPADLSKDDHGHLTTKGLFTFLLEATGSMGLSGPIESVFEAEGNFGFMYGVGDSLDFWAGYEFPISTPRQFNGGVVVGLIKHL